MLAMALVACGPATADCEVVFSTATVSGCRQAFDVMAEPLCGRPVSLRVALNEDTPGEFRLDRPAVVASGRWGPSRERWRLTGTVDGIPFERVLEVEDRRTKLSVLTRPRVDVFVVRSIDASLDVVGAPWSLFVTSSLGVESYRVTSVVADADTPQSVTSTSSMYREGLKTLVENLPALSQPYTSLRQALAAARPAAFFAGVAFVGENEPLPELGWIRDMRRDREGMLYLMVVRRTCADPLPVRFQELERTGLVALGDSCRDFSFEATLGGLVVVDYRPRLDWYLGEIDENSISVRRDGSLYAQWRIVSTPNGSKLELGEWLRNEPSSLIEVRFGELCVQ